MSALEEHQDASREISADEEDGGSRAQLEDQLASGELSLDVCLQNLVQRHLLREQDFATSPGPDRRSPGFPPLGRQKVPPPSEPSEPEPVIADAPAPRASPPRIPDDRFEIHERVGSGGTVEVFRATDRLARACGQDGTVALKLISAGIRNDPVLLAAVLRSAAAMRGLRHPNIEEVLELHRLGDERAIVAGWIDGESLARRLDEGAPLAPDRIRQLARELAEALDFAHARDVVHGDLKPANVMLGRDGRTRLIDFGFRVPGTSGPAGVPAGTTAMYASPEVLRGEEPTVQDDVYSLGCVLYRLLAGDWPWGTATALEAEQAGMNLVRPPAVTTREWRALSQALAFRREARPASAGELAAAFMPVASMAAGAWLPWAVAGAAALLGGLVTWFWLAPTSTPAPAAAPPTTASLTPTPTAEVEVAEEAGIPARPASSDPGTPAAFPRLVPHWMPRLERPVTVPLLADVPTSEIAEPPPAPRPPPAPPRPPTIGFAGGARVTVGESDRFVELPVQVRGSRLSQPVVLAVEAAAGTATLNRDYVPPVAELRLAPGQRQGRVLVSLLSDEEAEGDEEFSVTLSVVEGEALLDRNRVVIVIRDDD